MTDSYEAVSRQLDATLGAIRDQGLHKDERVLTTPQRAHIGVAGGAQVINLCANNYLGLADHPEVIRAAHEGLDRWGYGLSSVRFICGTQAIHKELEASLSKFLGMDDTILYTSCFDANTGLFETLLGPDDAIISDELNHASIIDGIRLCKAQRHRYSNNDMEALEARLQDASGARTRLIATDGVFSMDGAVADLPGICDLADRYGALVMVDDSHGVGFMGDNGRGTPEYHRVVERIDIVTGTLGKALGGASGGYTAARQEIVDLLRQRSRPYLFSNSLAPSIVTASLKAIELLAADTELRDRLVGQHPVFQGADRGSRVRDPAGTAPHRADHAGRRRARQPVRQPHARKRGLRNRVFLSRSCQKARPVFAHRFPPRIRWRTWKPPWRNLPKRRPKYAHSPEGTRETIAFSHSSTLRHRRRNRRPGQCPGRADDRNGQFAFA